MSLAIRLFHGSDIRVGQPVFGLGKRYNDYGLGFYCTGDMDMAREWAVDEDRNGFVNIYDLDTDGMTILNLSSREYCILHWITILIQNRAFSLDSSLARAGNAYLIKWFGTDYESYDIIQGYRADDSYFSFAQDFLNGTISVRQLSEAMKLGKLGEQTVLKSKQAFDNIVFIDAEPVNAYEWYPKRTSRSEVARKQYRKMNKEEWQRGEIYITHILDEEIKPDDARLQ
ncbi:MAG: DUF3990 domain-containing protein [Lachnospiraceae bacterium]|nr:DUF3990 domain-containing protein [Lachnospiraceae bacterium]